MNLRMEGRRLRELALIILMAAVVLFLRPVQALAMESPFDQARAFVQERLGEAITADALAHTAEEKGWAQERMGFAIFNLALINQGEPKEMYVPMNETSFNLNPGEVQEMLGEAIMEAAWANAYGERARTQEVLGLRIVNGALLHLGEFPVGMGGEDGPLIRSP